MKKNKGFTLIELLVVVAIIGILAAVGVVAYNGYTASAKANAAKTMHSQTIKYISAEIQKCSLGESKFMGTDQDCPATAGKAVTGAINTMTDKNPYDTANNAVLYGFLSVIVFSAAKARDGAVNTMTDKNPYSTADNAVKSSSQFVAGQVSVSASGSTVTVKTCTKSGCASADQLTGTISVD